MKLWETARARLFAMKSVPPAAFGNVDKPGIYAWWDARGALTPFWPQGFPPVDVSAPIYVGIAKQSLAERGVKIHLGSTRVSTVRRSLAALLEDELDLLPGATVKGGHLSLARPEEQRLTAWMHEHLTVTWFERPSPGDVEVELVGAVLPPLNSDFAHHGPYWRPMDVLKTAMRRSARQL